MKFPELNLHKNVLAGINAAKFTDCMPVQEKALPIALEGKDLMVQSKTGSGKTAVFVITFMEEYLRRLENGEKTACLIIAPTRELAQQIASDAKLLSSKIKGFNVGCFYGGTGYEKQKKQLKDGCAIYVATPGRLLDFIKGHEFDPSVVSTFVIDEADRLFDMGFYPDLKKIFRYLPSKDKRQTMLFSATLEERVRELAWEYMNEAQEVEMEAEHITVDSICQQLYHVSKADKFYLFLQLLTVENPSACLVFTNSRHMTEELACRLKLNNFNADFISGELSQKARDNALSNIKSGKTSILVATDVAARGLQIDNLPLVINYDLPLDYENYVHRIGRTARAGKSGKAISLADEEFVYSLESIENYIKMKIPVIWPENLPSVEDLSLGKSWRTRPERKIPVSKSSAKSGSKKNLKTGSEKISSSGKNVKKQVNYKSPQSLGKMTEEQRMEYYRKKYGFEPAKKSFISRLLGLFGK